MSIADREAIFNDYTRQGIEEYLSRREREHKWVDIVRVIQFCLNIAILLLSVYVFWNVTRIANEIQEETHNVNMLKKQVIGEINANYKKSIEDWQKANNINGSKKK